MLMGLEDQLVRDSRSFGRRKDLNGRWSILQYPQPMRTQVLDLDLGPRRSHHPQILLHLAILNKAQTSITHKHSKQSLLLGIIQRKHPIGINMLQFERLLHILNFTLRQFLLLIIDILNTIIPIYDR